MSEQPSNGKATVNLRRPTQEDRDRYLKRLRHELLGRWRVGERISVETLLVERPGLADDPEAVFELLLCEYQARQEHDETPSFGEYQQRFPSHASRLEHEIGLRIRQAVRRPAAPSQLLVAGELTLEQIEDSATVDFAKPSADSIADVVPGYEILDELGRGGMGVVYRARHCALGRIVAVKMILSARFACADELIRFRLEGETAGRLQHPNIVQVYEVGTHNEQPYMVLEFVQGGTLAKRMKEARFTLEQSARLIETLARAVQAAHSHGVIHRDLKPSNILLTEGSGDSALPFGTPKITDFGLAKHLDRASGLTETGRILGTPEYMAPEQAAGRKDVGPAADLYALGAMLYELLTGRPPFSSTQTMDTVLQVITREAASVRKLDAKIPRDLETICAKCLEKEPARRYESAAELADDLARFLDGRPIQARPVGLVERTVKWARRRPVIAGLLASLVLVSILGFAGVSSALVYALQGWRQAEFQTSAATNARTETERALDIVKDERQAAETARKVADEQRKLAEAAKGVADGARRQAEANVAFSRLAQARLEWRLNNVSASVSLLDQIDESRRGWEWNYLRGLHFGELAVFGRPNLLIAHEVRFSPDGKHVIAAGGNPFWRQPDNCFPSEVAIWETRTGKLVRVLKGMKHVAIAAGYSPDGQFIAACSLDGRIYFWNADTGQLVARVDTKSVPRGMAWSPDGKSVLTAGDGMLGVCDVQTRKFSRLPDEFFARAAAWHPSGKMLAVGGDKTQLWEWPSGKLIRDLKQSSVAVAFSPNGQQFALTYHSQTRIYDNQATRLLGTLSGHEGQILDIAFSPDSRQLASVGADSTIRLWDVRKTEQTSIWRGHQGRVMSVAFHPTGRYLVSGGAQPGEVSIWDLTRQQESLRIESRHGHSWIEAVALSDDGKRIYLCHPSFGGVEAIDSTTMQILARRDFPMHRKLIAPVTLADFNRDGSRLAVLSGDEWQVRVMEFETGKALRGHYRHLAPVSHLSMSGNGKRVASTGEPDRTPELQSEFAVWDADTGDVLLKQTRSQEITTTLKLNADGSVLVRAVQSVAPGRDKQGRPIYETKGHRIEVWDVPTTGSPSEKPRQQFHVEGGNQVGLALDEKGHRLAACSWDGLTRVWDTKTGRMVFAEPLEGHQTLQGLAFSPDGRLLAGVSRTQVTLWDVRQGIEVYRLRGGPPRTQDLRFNPRVLWSRDGKKLLCTNWENSVAVWDCDDFGSKDKRKQWAAADARANAWHAERCQQALMDDDYEAGKIHLAHLERHQGRTAALRIEQGYLYTRVGDWGRMAKAIVGSTDLARERRPTQLRECAFMCLEIGDWNRFGRCRAIALEELRRDHDYYYRGDLLLIWAMAPLGEMGERIVKEARAFRRMNESNWWCAFVSAVLLLRAGELDEAIELHDAMMKLKGNAPFAEPAMKCVLVQALYRKGKTEEARKVWDEAKIRYAEEYRIAQDRVPHGRPWRDVILVRWLMAETEHVLAGR